MKYLPQLPAFTVILASLNCVLCTWGAQPAVSPVSSVPLSGPIDYATAADEVMRHIQQAFYLPRCGLYAHSLTDRKADFMWGNGIMFTALIGAARHDARTYSLPMSQFFNAMNRYWDSRAPIPGYEASQKLGGHDKYYDDNAWMVLACLEAFEMTQDRAYLDRAQQALTFVLSGWDDQGGGGIWWQETHLRNSKNTCSNAPAAVSCLCFARYLPADQARENVAMARKIVDWTTKNLETDDGLFADSISLRTGKINGGKLTYNTALMIRAFLGLWGADGDQRFLEKAQRAAAASDWFLDARTHAYRDSFKWAHLMVEADLQMYRATEKDYLLQRAKNNADYEYETWKRSPSDELIDNASVARTLWLMADMQCDAGRQFWQRMDRAVALKP